jgi:hypothetical protein
LSAIEQTAHAGQSWLNLNQINEQRTAAGKSSVGFVNPTLYANPSAFYDITSGTNPGCESNGFAAVSGWVSFYMPIITCEQTKLILFFL